MLEGVSEKMKKQDKKAFIGLAFVLALTGVVLSDMICGKLGISWEDELSKYSIENIHDERMERLNSLKKLIELDEDDFMSHYEIGKIYNELQSFKIASEHLTQADKISEEPFTNEELEAKVKYGILTELAHSFSKQNLFNEAIKLLERAKKIDPRQTEAYNKKGNIHDERREHQKARGEYQKAKRINKKEPESYRNLAIQAFRRNQKRDAFKELKSAVRNNPRSFKAFENLGDGYQRTKSFGKAITSYQRALELMPSPKDRSRIYYKMAKTYQKWGDQFNYEKNLEEAAHQTRFINTSASEELGDIYLKKGDVKEALKHYRKALSRNSTDQDLRRKYTKAYNDLKNQIAPVKNDKGNDAVTVFDDTLSNEEVPEARDTRENQGWPDVSSLISEGTEAFKNKQYAIAEQEFLKARDKAPQYPRIDYFLARSQDKLNKNEEAIENYNKAIQKNPKEKKSFYYLGVLHYRQGKYPEALDAFKKAAKIDPGFANANYSQGLCYDKLGQHSRAIDSYKAALSINPELYQGHFNLGISYKKANKLVSALNSFSEAEKINSNDPNLFYQRGELFNKQKKLISAETEYEKAIGLNPKHYEARFNLALIQSKTNREARAKETLNRLQEERPEDPAISYQLGIIAESEKEYELAIAEYKKAIEKNINYYKAYLNLGGIYSVLEQYEQAESTYQKAFELKPNSFAAPMNLGNLYLRAENYADAGEYYEKALSVRSDHIETRLVFAQTLEKLESYQKSKQQYLLILDQKPDHLAAMEGLAFLYHRKLKDKVSAKNFFQNIISYYPDHPKKEEYQQMIQLLTQR